MFKNKRMRRMPPQTAAASNQSVISALQRAAYGLAGFGIFIFFWFLAGYALFANPSYRQFSDMLPVPTLLALREMVGEPVFWQSIAASLRRVMVGILLAFLFGLPAGLLLGFYRKLRLMANGPIQFLRMVSPLSWMPIALLFFATFESAIYFLITVATVWPVLLTTSLGVGRVNRQWLQMARNQGASSSQLILRVVLPATAPFIFTSLRLALGVAWIVLVPVEFLGVSSGLGYLINDARDTLEYGRLTAVVLAIGILGFLLDTLIQSLQRYFNWSWSS